jgi:hypothetical protein
MEINDVAYGGLVVSQNVNKGRPIRYSYVPQLNGWTIYSCDDSDEYVNYSKNLNLHTRNNRTCAFDNQRRVNQNNL